MTRTLLEIRALLYKELLLEWKQKYAFNGMLLYVISMVFVIALAFGGDMNPQTWNIILWISLLFVAINAVARSFLAESRGQMLYLYTLAGPHAVIAAKMIFNCSLLFLMGFATMGAYALFSPVSIEGLGVFVLALFLGSTGLAANLSLVSAIAAKARNSATLLAVLSFPLVIPLLLTVIRATGQGLAGAPPAESASELLFLGSLIVIIALISLILFPYLWRE